MSTEERPFSLRSVALAAFLPTLFFSTGEGAIIPIIPIAAHNLGASLAIAGFISGMIMLGEVVGDVPSGWVVGHLGERKAMIWAAVIAIVGVLIAVVAPNPWVLAIGIFLDGLATAVFALARHAFMTTYVPIHYRARALSTLGGVFRAGWFVGPLIAAGIIQLTGTAQSAFWIFIIGCLGAVVVLVTVEDPAAKFVRPAKAGGHGPAAPTEGAEQAAERTSGLFQTIWAYRGVLVRMGTGAALIGGLRATRTVILPLWAVSIGIGESQTALIIGIAGAIDFGLFYASGQIMDRFGRGASAIPSMVGLGLGLLVLAFTHDLGARLGWFIAIAMVLSVANGIGSGILMTLGADLAPQSKPAAFLGAWRFTGDVGNAAAPLVVSALTGLASLAIASGVMGVIGIAGAVMLARWIPRYVPWKPRPAR
jgi:MFS family permease